MRPVISAVMIVLGVSVCGALGAPAAGDAPASLLKEVPREQVEALAASIDGRTLIVDWHGTWDYATIQAALNAAESGDTIIVLPSTGSPSGAYVENITIPAIPLTLRSINPEDPAVVAATIIDGNQAGSVVTFAEGASTETGLNGFTIRNGTGTVSGDFRNGGGIYCSSSSPMITNCTITGNTVSNSGGGVYCSSSSPTILNCMITENNADASDGGSASGQGGGISCSDASSPMIINCTITSNGAYALDSGDTNGQGAGVFCSSASSPTITNCTIAENHAIFDGGGVSCNNSSPTITNCTITGNKGLPGGGIACIESSPTITNCTIGENGDRGIYCHNSSPTITNCTITGNSGYRGGGVECRSSSPTITNCTIARNSASTGGGVHCWDHSSPTIANCTITGNGAFSGGGIYCSEYSSPTIANCTMAGNNASDGGGIYCYSSSPTITNNIVAFNSAAIYNTGSGAPVLRYNCVFGNTGYNYSGVTDPTGTDGNVSADPKLADVPHGNVHIQPDSPCREAGDDAVVQAGWLDMDGQPRIQDGRVDIGADESDGTRHQPGPYVIVRVAPDGDDSNDGSRWGLAKRTVQAGIDAAATAGGEVWVRAGTYLERITLHSYAHVYGGFSGLESQRGQRAWAANPTVLDGQADGSVITIEAGYRVSTIDGFIVRNGHASEYLFGDYGGGICCRSSSPAIANCTIVGNIADYAGGGVSCSGSFPTIVNCTITGNSTEIGGGVYCSSSSATIVNCTITENSAYSGGGIYHERSSSPTIANCIIAGNNAVGGAGGGVYCYLSFVRISNCVIKENSAPHGGGVYCGASSVFQSPSIANCAITRNNATSGGGITCRGSSPKITNCTLVSNSAPDGGGVVWFPMPNAVTSPTITNTIVAFNTSGFYGVNSSPFPGVLTLQYNCVYGNTAYDFSGVADPTGTNGNLSADPLFRSASPGPDATWGTTDDVLNSLRLQAESPCIDAGNNADVPADLADLDGDGDTTEPMPFDLAGLLRFVDDPATADTGAGTPPIVDMGAYEYFLTAKADFDTDGDVDSDDLAVFEACATGPAVPYNPAELPEPEPGCTLTPNGNGHIAADFDEDSDVDQSDFGMFQRCYSGEGNTADPDCTN